MNLSTILIGTVIAALLALAVRYLVKNGMCAACEDRAACQAAKKAATAGGTAPENGGADSAGCGGKCSACRYYEMELRAAGKRAGS